MVTLNKLQKYGNLNTHDILKIAAIIAMIIGHYGNYFLPEELTLRVIGRVAVPVFLFLVGYSLQYKFRASVLFFAIASTLTDLIFHLPILPLNILYTIVFWRFVMFKIEKSEYSIENNLFFLFTLVIFLTLPMVFILDGDSLAFLFILCGYLTRKNIKGKKIILFYSLTYVISVAATLFYFDFSPIQQTSIIILVALMMYIFYNYSFSKLNIIKNKVLIYIIKFMSRYSLYIYGTHVIIFKIIATMLYPDEYSGFSWLPTPDK